MEASKIYGLKSAQRDSVPIKKLLISANLFHFAAHVVSFSFSLESLSWFGINILSL